MESKIITRTYRIITDDGSSYTIQKKYMGPSNIVPSIEYDVENILNKAFIILADTLFIPTNKIKKIIFVNSEENRTY